jgi:uncharacterized protein GlcG (DUF336 family)
MKRILVSALLLGALVAAPVLAQPAPPAPGGAPAADAPGRGPGGAGRGPAMPSVKGPAGPNAPVALTPAQEIPLAQALDAAQTAVAHCLALTPRTSQAAVMVVDLNGNIKVQLAADGTGLAFFDFARRKAYTVLKKKMSSEDFGKLPEVAAAGRGAVLEGDPELITFPGATPILKGGQMIGVFSVSGPTGGGEDMKCMNAGMAKFKL